MGETPIKTWRPELLTVLKILCLLLQENRSNREEKYGRGKVRQGGSTARGMWRWVQHLTTERGYILVISINLGYFSREYSGSVR